MKSRSLIAFSALAVAGLVGCQKDDQGYKQHVDQQLDERFSALEARLDKIDRSLGEIAKAGGPAAGAGRPAAPRQPQKRPGTPDPSATYAVPTGNSPYRGAEHAKVTIVEAFEFA